MSLTATAIKNAKVADRPRRLTDGGGLYLLLNTNGSRWWRLDYRYAGKRKTLSMGTYPDTGLNDARSKRDAARKLLAEGVDPGERRKAIRMVGRQIAENDSAGGAARAPFAKKASNWAGSLEALGIDEMEERTYRALLAHRMATAQEIATELSLSRIKAQRLLDSIESKGLSTHAPERPLRYIASPPELAVQALASQRQAGIERALLAIPELKKQAENPADQHEREQVVELITNRVVLGQILVQLHHTIQKEGFAFQCAPMLFTGLINKQEMHENVRIRSISDEGFLALPGALESLRIDIERGEEARVFPSLPVKMLVGDRRIGLIPLSSGNTNSPILLLRECALLDALCSLFELIWEKATPIVFTRAGKMETIKPMPLLSEVAEQVIPMLAAGLNDKAIAHELRISDATLTRRIAELMKCFSTRTRFQLGWRAAVDAFPKGLPLDAVSEKASVRR